MKSIIIPVNFSDGASNAARYAADMALAIQAEIHLLHVVQLPLSTAEVPLPNYVFDEMQKNGVILLDTLREELVKRTKGAVPVTIHMEVGDVEKALEALCHQVKPFLVVMGVSPPSLERVLAGSKTATAVRHLSYPVLAVPQKASFHAIRRIVLACDLDDIGEGVPASLDFFKELKDLFGAHFDVVSVITRAEQAEGQAVFEFDSWKIQLQEIYPEIHFIRTPKVEEGVSDYLATHPADWLLVFPKKHGFFEFHSSKSGKIALHCAVPVMSIHG